jgi:ferredoxin
VTAGYRIVVHADRCAASGGCRQVAPEVFGSEPGGWVRLLDESPDRPLDDVLDAHDACPLNAIDVLDDAGRSLA